MEHDLLLGTTVVEPLVERSGLHDRADEQADGVAGANSSAANDGIFRDSQNGHWLTDAFDVDGGAAMKATGYG